MNSDRTHTANDVPPVISIIEPTWDQRVHLPFMIGLIKVIVQAYPHARFNFVGGQQQIELLQQSISDETIRDIHFVPWNPGPDKDTLPQDVFNTVQKFKSLPELITYKSDLIILTSCTSNTLSAVSHLGLASKTCTFLHGNAKDLVGWRSRNPIRRHFDFTSAIKTFSRRGGKAIVLEPHIKKRLAELFPWMEPHVVNFPHPLVLEEGDSPVSTKQLSTPVHIGFAGLATIAKGFSDYLEFAKRLNELRPNTFTFHSFGTVPNESKHLDQTPLDSPAKSLSRTDFISSLGRMHYLFSWQHEEYYEFAASGTVYDAINLCIPIIAKSSDQLSEWRSMGFIFGNTYNDIDDAVAHFSALDIESEQSSYSGFINSAIRLRETFRYEKLGTLFASLFPIES